MAIHRAGLSARRGTGPARNPRGSDLIGQDQECCVYPNLVENAVQQKVVDLLMTNQGIADRMEAWMADRP